MQGEEENAVKVTHMVSWTNFQQRVKIEAWVVKQTEQGREPAGCPWGGRQREQTPRIVKPPVGRGGLPAIDNWGTAPGQQGWSQIFAGSWPTSRESYESKQRAFAGEGQGQISLMVTLATYWKQIAEGKWDSLELLDLPTLKSLQDACYLSASAGPWSCLYFISI